MSTTGAKAPTAVVTASESPWSDNDWTTPENIYGAGTASVTAATFDAGDQTYVLKARGFDFSVIPDGATIDGVICKITAYYATDVASIDLCQLLNTSSAKVGTNHCSTPVNLTTGPVEYTEGASNDKWGNALTAAWVKNSNFGVAIGCLAGGTGNNNVDVYIDTVTLEVYYTAGSVTIPVTAETATITEVKPTVDLSSVKSSRSDTLALAEALPKVRMGSIINSKSENMIYSESSNLELGAIKIVIPITQYD